MASYLNRHFKCFTAVIDLVIISVRNVSHRSLYIFRENDGRGVRTQGRQSQTASVHVLACLLSSYGTSVFCTSVSFPV